MVAGLVFPVVFLLDLPPAVQEIISSVGFFVAASASLNALFFPKAYMLYSGQDIDKNLEIKKVTQPATGQIVHPNLPTNFNANEAVMAGTAALKGMSSEQKIEVCRLQLDQWRALLIYYGDRAGSGTGTGTGTGSGSHTESNIKHSASIEFATSDHLKSESFSEKPSSSAALN